MSRLSAAGEKDKDREGGGVEQERKICRKVLSVVGSERKTCKRTLRQKVGHHNELASHVFSGK